MKIVKSIGKTSGKEFINFKATPGDLFEAKYESPRQFGNAKSYVMGMKVIMDPNATENARILGESTIGKDIYLTLTKVQMETLMKAGNVKGKKITGEMYISKNPVVKGQQFTALRIQG